MNLQDTKKNALSLLLEVNVAFSQIYKSPLCFVYLVNLDTAIVFGK